MPNYGFTQHGFKWFVTARNRRFGEPFKHAADAQAEARRMMAENIPIPDLKPKRERSGKAKPSPGSVGRDERLRSNRGNQLGTFARP